MQIANMSNIGPVDAGAMQSVQAGQGTGFAGYAAGETVTASVVGVQDDSASIQLPNGTQIETQLPPGVQVNVGDTVELTLMTKSPGTNMAQVQLNSVNGQTVNLEASQLEAYLMDQGVPPSKTNEAAAEVLIRNQIAPTARNISNLVDIATTLPRTPTSVAVTMAANNIAPTQKNVDLLLKLATEPPSLGGDVQALEGSVARAGGVDAFISALEGNLQQAAGENGSIAQNISQAPGFEQLAQQLAGAPADNGGKAGLQQAVQDFVATLDLPPEQQQAAQNVILEAYQLTTGESLTEQPAQAAQNTPSDAEVAAQQAPPEGDTAAAQQSGEAQTQTGTPQRAQGAQAAPLEAPATKADTPKTGQTQRSTAPQGEEAVAAQAKETETTTAAKVTDTEEPVQPQTAQPQARQDAAEVGLRNEASQILKTLNKFVAKLQAQDSETDGKALQDSVKDQRELAAMTKAGVARMFGQTAPQTQRADAMSSQIRMGSQFDQFYYAQVPFQTLQQQGTAELYVFKRNPQKAEAEKTHVTVLIGLDTEHMGRVETVLRSADGKLSVEFRVASKRIQKYFEDAVREFSSEMRESGFPVQNVTVSQIKEKTTPLNAMKVMEPEKKVRLQGLDIEA